MSIWCVSNRLKTVGVSLVSIPAATILLWAPPAYADPTPNQAVAYCQDMAALGHLADCATLASYGRGVCAQFDKGYDWYTILTRLDTITKDQQFSADILVAAVSDICPWNESKKP
jgi:Protein of unknown function (DUF732)